MTGRLIAIVGPSGVGKDTVMVALAAAEPRLSLVRRVITRTADAGGEDFDAVDRAQFNSMRDAGALALCWQAHQLSYGIPAKVDRDLAARQDLVVNLSRGVLRDAKARFAQIHIVALTAHPDVLAKRLAARGRENSAQIALRLARAETGLPDGIDAVRVDNSGALGATVSTVLASLYPVSA